MPQCSVVRLAKETMTSEILEKPGLTGLFLAYMLRSKGDLHDALESQIFDSTEVKLARRLLRWANFDGSVGRIGRKFTHEELGQLIGASRETVTRLMNEFREKGYIQYNRELTSTVYATLFNVLLPRLSI